MDDNIKSVIKTARESLDKLDGLLESFIDDLPEHTKDAQQRSRVVMKKVREQLDTATDKAEEGAAEAELQAHLGLMEAKDKIEASRPVIEEFLKDAADKSKTAFDEAELKAKLAAMEAEDFWETRGKDMSREFQESAEKMASVATEAATELQSRLESWVTNFQQKK